MNRNYAYFTLILLVWIQMVYFSTNTAYFSLFLRFWASFYWITNYSRLLLHHTSYFLRIVGLFQVNCDKTEKRAYNVTWKYNRWNLPTRPSLILWYFIFGLISLNLMKTSQVFVADSNVITNKDKEYCLPLPQNDFPSH